MQVSAPRIMVAGTASGVGKTTLACGLLSALQRRGLRLQACKCGPDYLDPLFHTRVLGVPARNLDLFLGDAALARELLVEGARDADLTLLEGVMGYYDGIAASDEASSWDLARSTDTPVVLVVDGRGRALSVAAEVRGFLGFRSPSMVAGVVVNHVSPSYASTMRALVERECGVPVLGCLPELGDLHLASRHLGLVTPGEMRDVAGWVSAVGDAVARHIDLAALCALADGAPALSFEPRPLPAPCDAAPVVAVAHDEAFCFCYHDTLELLKRLGACVAFFSPLRDDRLPEGTCGLYLVGGYPELHARGLAANVRMREAVRAAIADGMPTVAECGGFLYLHESLEDADGVRWPMAGALAGGAYRTDRLGRFGYATLTAAHDSLLARAGERLRAHEFHYWESEWPGDAFRAEKPQSGRSWECVVATETLHAGFPHLYLRGNPDAARRFVEACASYGRAQGRRCP